MYVSVSCVSAGVYVVSSLLSLPRSPAILGKSKLQSSSVRSARVVVNLRSTCPSCSVLLPPSAISLYPLRSHDFIHHFLSALRALDATSVNSTEAFFQRRPSDVHSNPRPQG